MHQNGESFIIKALAAFAHVTLELCSARFSLDPPTPKKQSLGFHFVDNFFSPYQSKAYRGFLSICDVFVVVIVTTNFRCLFLRLEFDRASARIPRHLAETPRQ